MSVLSARVLCQFGHSVDHKQVSATRCMWLIYGCQLSCSLNRINPPDACAHTHTCIYVYVYVCVCVYLFIYLYKCTGDICSPSEGAFVVKLLLTFLSLIGTEWPILKRRKNVIWLVRLEARLTTVTEPFPAMLESSHVPLVSHCAWAMHNLIHEKKKKKTH